MTTLVWLVVALGIVISFCVGRASGWERGWYAGRIALRADLEEGSGHNALLFVEAEYGDIESDGGR